jgi:hypothetical protein
MGNYVCGGTDLRVADEDYDVISHRARKHIIYLTSGQATLYIPVDGQCQAIERYGSDPAGAQRCAELLAEFAEVDTHIVTDVMEEEFHIGAVPHTAAWSQDRRAVLARHGERTLRNTPYRYTLVLGREKSGRRDDRVLCAGLTQPELLTPWVDALLSCKVALAGIHSVPLTLQSLVRVFDGGSGPSLLVMKVNDQVRLSYFQDARLTLSRLTPLRQGRVSEMADTIMREVEKTQLYLGRLRLAPQDRAIRVWVVAQGMLLDMIAGAPSNKSVLDYRPTELNQAARRADLRGSWDTADAEALIAQLVLQRTPENHYAEPAQQRYARWYRLNRRMTVAAGVCIAAASIGAAWNVDRAMTLAEEQTTLQRDATLLAYRSAALEQTLPAMPIDSDEVKLAVLAADKLTDLRASPSAMLRPLGSVLARFPDLYIERIAWRTITPEIAAAESETGSEPASTDAAEWTDEQGRYRVRKSARISGHLGGFSGDYRRAVARLHELAAALRANGQFTAVTVLKEPLNTDPRELLEVSSGGQAGEPVASFVIEAVRDDYYES